MCICEVSALRACLAGLLAAPASLLFTTVRYCLKPQEAAKTQLCAAPSDTRHSKEEPEPFSVAATVGNSRK